MADLLTSMDNVPLTSRFLGTRSLTDSLSAPLSAEDQTVQSMPEVSPTKCCLLYTSPSPRDRQKSRMPSSA